MITLKTVLRYILLQIPALVFLIIAVIITGKFINIPGWMALTIIIVWIVKDIVMFSKVWRSYDVKASGYEERMIGMKGVVIDELNPAGYVKIMGEFWKAEIKDGEIPVKKGEEIRVIEIKNMKLIVGPSRLQDHTHN